MNAFKRNLLSVLAGVLVYASPALGSAPIPTEGPAVPVSEGGRGRAVDWRHLDEVLDDPSMRGSVQDLFQEGFGLDRSARFDAVRGQGSASYRGTAAQNKSLYDGLAKAIRSRDESVVRQFYADPSRNAPRGDDSPPTEEVAAKDAEGKSGKGIGSAAAAKGPSDPRLDPGAQEKRPQGIRKGVPPGIILEGTRVVSAKSLRSGSHPTVSSRASRAASGEIPSRPAGQGAAGVYDRPALSRARRAARASVAYEPSVVSARGPRPYSRSCSADPAPADGPAAARVGRRLERGSSFSSHEVRVGKRAIERSFTRAYTHPVQGLSGDFMDAFNVALIKYDPFRIGESRVGSRTMKVPDYQHSQFADEVEKLVAAYIMYGSRGLSDRNNQVYGAVSDTLNDTFAGSSRLQRGYQGRFHRSWSPIGQGPTDASIKQILDAFYVIQQETHHDFSSARNKARWIGGAITYALW